MGKISRRKFISRTAAGTAALTVADGFSNNPLLARSEALVEVTGVGSDGAPDGLIEPALRPLPTGSIRPQGWLLRQLQIQADGLTGSLDRFWPDVADSQWFGGSAEGWERAPYWLDGSIPLAWILGHQQMQERISGYVDHIVSHQRPDGWYSSYPSDSETRPYDMWAILLANKVLVQYHEATGDHRVLDAVIANLQALHRTLEVTPLFGWGRFRWFEGLIPIFYAYERTGEDWLLRLGRTLRRQGFDYQEFYRGHDVTVPTPRRGLWKWDKHVVNTAMAAKAGALAWRLDGRDPDRHFPSRMLALLDRYHGQVTGMFTGDETLAGRNPLQGTELCAVVEFLYSLELLVSVLGEATFGDRVERVAYNALPATFTPDMWAHQYDQQVNQVQCTINPDHMFTTNGPEANIYGLEPNFGCCTANMHQGWPKFVSHLLMGTRDGGLAVTAWAPSTGWLTCGGVPVDVEIETDYPFRETIRLHLTADQPARFPLLLRVPTWADGATILVAGGAAEPMAAGNFHRVEREWSGRVEIQVRFPMEAKTSRHYNDSVVIERGPLVYSLEIGETWTRVNEDKPHRELPHADFEVRPSTPWNYGLIVDEAQPERSIRFEERPVGEMPFSPVGAGMAARVRGRQIPNWSLRDGWAAEIAPPINRAGGNPEGEYESAEPIQEVTLIPYGCTNIRVTEFPKLSG